MKYNNIPVVVELNIVICGDCLEEMRKMEDNSIDSIVTDPPYGLKFMGKKWDYDVPSVEIWKECLRVLKPGGFLLSFAGTRTYHRMVVNIEDAGFQVRDMIAWIYGSGFPKSLNIGKMIDKKMGKKSRVIGYQTPVTDEAKQWEGWGTALKPACEPICVARKPLEGTVAENVLKYGVGGLNIDGCRVRYTNQNDMKITQSGIDRLIKSSNNGVDKGMFNNSEELKANDISLGRFPANLIHDGSEEVVELFPDTDGGCFPAKLTGRSIFGLSGLEQQPRSMGDSGSASRFFYCAKANKADRDAGCEGLEEQNITPYCENGNRREGRDGTGTYKPRRNPHPTVKPTALMRYLVRLVTPPNGIILDPFFGSGSTGKAAKLEHFNYIGIEMDKDYCEIARLRIAAAKDEPVKKKKMKLKKLV